MNPASRTVQGAAELDIDPATIAALREVLPTVAEETIAAIIVEVPSYAGALSGRMGTNIRVAVQTALGVFLDLIGGAADPESEPSLGAGAEAVYELGRGEARNGRTMEALLAAYRVGARVSWRGLSDAAVGAGLPADTMAKFAELVFTYIDELSATSAAGHADELATQGRAKERYREQLGRFLIDGVDDDELTAAAERADWVLPRTLTAVLLATAQAHPVRRLLDARTLLLTDGVPDLDDSTAVLLVPDAEGVGRPHLLRLLRTADAAGATVGPARPWQHVRTSFLRALRAREWRDGGSNGPRVADGGPLDTEEHLVRLVLRADAQAHDDLRTRVLAPMASLRPATAARLRETLLVWLLRQGRRDEVAAELFVHPQTVRYRMGQIRELYGDALDDPNRVLELVIALGVDAQPE